jgi:hypothetical protein
MRFPDGPAAGLQPGGRGESGPRGALSARGRAARQEDARNVDKYRAMVCRRAWLMRWVVGSANDLLRAFRRILVHLRWRQEYGLDTIMDEDWSKHDARGEMCVPCALRPTLGPDMSRTLGHCRAVFCEVT